MQAIKDGNTLILPLSGELNSVNADQVEKEINATLEKYEFEKLVLDFRDMVYVSSAGLRVILKLKQKYKNVAIVEVSLGVYDVLSMTGFTDIMEIHKALVFIDVSHAEVVGEGFFSTVYRIDKDTIVKVFNRVSDPDQIQRELNLAKQAFILGIPTAISYDIVRVGEKLGVRFEMLDCTSLKNVYREHPENYGDLTKKYVDLLHTINTTEPSDDRLPSVRSFYQEKLEAAKPHIGEEAYKRLGKLLDELPNPHTFVHGDCHFKNIMVQNDELILIDMDTLAYGNPIFELAAIYAPYCAFEEDDPGNSEVFLGMSGAFCRQLFVDLLKGYLGKQDVEEDLTKVRIVCYLHMIWWTLANTPENTVRLQGNTKRLLELLPKVENLSLNYGPSKK